jgi:hypothetical protein
MGRELQAAANESWAYGRLWFCHPTTSSHSHRCKGILLGVLRTHRNPKMLEFSVFSRRFRIGPGEPSKQNFSVYPDLAVRPTAGSNRRRTTSRIDDDAQQRRSPVRATRRAKGPQAPE